MLAAVLFLLLECKDKVGCASILPISHFSPLLEWEIFVYGTCDKPFPNCKSVTTQSVLLSRFVHIQAVFAPETING